MFKVDLSKKVVAITGAGGVICSEFAKALASNGAKVALLDRHYERAIAVFLPYGKCANFVCLLPIQIPFLYNVKKKYQRVLLFLVCMTSDK